VDYGTCPVHVFWVRCLLEYYELFNFNCTAIPLLFTLPPLLSWNEHLYFLLIKAVSCFVSHLSQVVYVVINFKICQPKLLFIATSWWSSLGDEFLWYNSNKFRPFIYEITRHVNLLFHDTRALIHSLNRSERQLILESFQPSTTSFLP
jgi:hypothetical protein